MNIHLSYARWLDIADELEALHWFLYGDDGYLVHRANSPFKPSGLEVAQWIRHKCATGRWYWWDKTTIAAKAEWPLKSLDHVIGDSGGLYESSAGGRQVIDRIEQLQSHIDAVRRL